MSKIVRSGDEYVGISPDEAEVVVRALDYYLSDLPTSPLIDEFGPVQDLRNRIERLRQVIEASEVHYGREEKTKLGILDALIKSGACNIDGNVSRILQNWTRLFLADGMKTWTYFLPQPSLLNLLNSDVLYEPSWELRRVELQRTLVIEEDRASWVNIGICEELELILLSVD